MTRIVTVTLNPALDLTTAVDRLVDGDKLRCDTPTVEAGGGGVNVSRAIAKLGRASLPFVAVGGGTGQVFKDTLEAEGLTAAWFTIPAPPRQSLAVHERASGAQYRFVLPGAQWAEGLCAEVMAALRDTVEAGDLVVASGSLPPGTPDDTYRQMAAEMAELNVRTVIDTSGRALEAVAAGGGAPAATLRMDQSEASQLLKQETLNTDEAIGLAQDLVAQGVARAVLITLGARGAVLVTAGQGWRVTPPKVTVASKVGAGDSLAAGFAIGLSEGWSWPDCLAYAMAAATSAVTTPGTELCTRAGTERYRTEMVISALSPPATS